MRVEFAFLDIVPMSSRLRWTPSLRPSPSLPDGHQGGLESIGRGDGAETDSGLATLSRPGITYLCERRRKRLAIDPYAASDGGHASLCHPEGVNL